MKIIDFNKGVISQWESGINEKDIKSIFIKNISYGD